MEKRFYELSQNNSGGSFDLNERLCHRLYIEAEDVEKAVKIAEGFGCYWDGVEKGMDCPCCGDRWHRAELVDLEKINTQWNGYEITEWLDGKGGTHMKDVAIQNLKAQYPGQTWLVESVLENKYGSTRVIGRIRLNSIEQYAQIMANLYGFTKPDGRVFYANGGIKEIHSAKVKK
jgi:hypothetical protein